MFKWHRCHSYLCLASAYTFLNSCTWHTNLLLHHNLHLPQNGASFTEKYHFLVVFKSMHVEIIFLLDFFLIYFYILAILLSLHWTILSILCQKYTLFKFCIAYLVNKMIKFLFSIMFNILFIILFFKYVNLAIQ